MATIYAMPNQSEWDRANDWQDKSMTYDQKSEMAEKLLAQIPEDQIIRFGVADGYAQYWVRSLKPLQICHIPYGDAYRADRLIEKALNVTECKRLLGQEAKMRKLFSRQK